MYNLHLHLFDKHLRFRLLGLFLAFALCTLAVLTCLAGSANAQTPPKPNVWIVTISDDPDPVPSGGTLTYKVSAKNDGPVQSQNVKVTIDLPSSPPGIQFVSCKTSLDTGTVKYCPGVTGNQVIATFPVVKAHKSVTVTVVINVPTVDTITQLSLKAKAEGKSAFKGDDTERTTLLLPDATATLLPSGQTVTVFCGSILDKSFFQSDNIMHLNSTLGCLKSAPFGLKVAESGVTLNLRGNKIVVSGAVAGNAGILVGAGATNVTIDGGGTNGTNGIELFDWCVRDEGGNTGLVVKNLRCYKARSAALDIVSDNVELSKLKIDSTTPTATTTWALPGGVGIHTQGDNVRIKDTIVRRSKLIGILANGVDTDLSGYATTIDGNTQSSIVEKNAGVGIVFQNGPHLLKDTAVYGDGPGQGTSTDGVMIDTGIGNRLDGVVVKKFNGNGVVVNAGSTIIERTGVDNVSQNGFVISALTSNVVLNGNSSKNLGGDGFVVEGDNNQLITNRAEKNLGHGFRISSNGNRVENSGAKSNGGNGFVVTGSNNQLLISKVEKSFGHGFHINGTGNWVANNSVQSNNGSGFIVTGNNNQFITNKVEKNLSHGFRINGTDNWVANNSVESNSGSGFVIAGVNTSCSNNLAQRNGSYEWTIGANNIDKGSNFANSRRFSFTGAGGVFE